MMNNPYSGGTGMTTPAIPYSGQFGNSGQFGTTAGYPSYGQMPQAGFGFPSTMPNGSFIPGGFPSNNGQQVGGSAQLPIESSFVENILRLNLGKPATLYMTYENNSEWNAKIFKGILEAAGRDHIIISDPQTGVRTLLLMVNLDYITFNEELNYAYPYA